MEWEKQLEEMISSGRELDRLVNYYENIQLENLWLKAETARLTAESARLKRQTAELEEICRRQDLLIRLMRGMLSWAKSDGLKDCLPLFNWLQDAIDIVRVQIRDMSNKATRQ